MRMWKDFFYFNKGEKRAIIVLTLLIAISQLIIWTSDIWINFLPHKQANAAIEQKKLLALGDSLSSGFDGEKYASKHRSKNSGLAPKLAPFNPNTADSASLVALGIRPYIAKNIQKYRQKGGIFRKPEDFARIYGVDQVLFSKLEPFIRIAFEVRSEKKASTSLEFETLPKEVQAAERDLPLVFNDRMEAPKLSMPEGSPVITKSFEINRLDTITMQQIKGVGAFTAKRIDQYRSRLGGFYSIRQLEEVKGLYPDVLSRLKTLLTADSTRIIKLNVNKASLEKLKSHPYLSFYQAKVVVELRKARSGIKRIEELADFKEFSKLDIDRLRWYLSF